MNAIELRLPQLGHPCLFWWDLAASAMQTFCAASKLATAYFDKIGQATVAAFVYPMVSSSELLGMTPRSGWRAVEAMGAMQARQVSLAVVGSAVHPDPMPAEPTPTPTSPSPDPAVPEIEDPPAVEVPMPQHVTPVMPTPKADAEPISNAEADAAASEASSSETAAGAAAPLSRPALVQAPQGEDGPLISEADPTSNAG